jgi:hypothetical protein
MGSLPSAEVSGSEVWAACRLLKCLYPDIIVSSEVYQLEYVTV